MLSAQTNFDPKNKNFDIIHKQYKSPISKKHKLCKNL